MSLLTSLFLGVLLAQPAMASARAEGEIVCTGPLPFSEEEVEEAFLARWPLLGGASVVQVKAEGGKTFVRVGGAEREVNLEGRGGEEAARIVAVMALDLAQAGTPFAVSTAANEPAASVSTSVRPSPATKSEHVLRMGLSLLSPFDQSGWVAHFEPTLDAAWEVVPGLGAFLSAGYRQTRYEGDGRSLLLHEIPLRAGPTLRRRWLEARAGLIARPRLVEGAGSYETISWGAAVSVAARFALTAKLALVLAAGLDVFRNRTVFAINQSTALTTSWLGPWVGAGVAWETVL